MCRCIICCCFFVMPTQSFIIVECIVIESKSHFSSLWFVGRKIRYSTEYSHSKNVVYLSRCLLYPFNGLRLCNIKVSVNEKQVNASSGMENNGNCRPCLISPVNFIFISLLDKNILPANIFSSYCHVISKDWLSSNSKYSFFRMLI